MEPAPSLKCETARNTASSTVLKPEWVSFVARCQMKVQMHTDTKFILFSLPPPTHLLSEMLLLKGKCFVTCILNCSVNCKILAESKCVI